MAVKLKPTQLEPSLTLGGLVHERVAVSLGRVVGLLDRAGAGPADQVQEAARLVVRPRGAAAAERLEADDGAGRLVVDVEVAGGVYEPLARLLDRRPLVGEDRAGERVGAGPIAEVERLLPLPVRVGVDGEDRAEELLLQEPEVGVGGLDHTVHPYPDG